MGLETFRKRTLFRNKPYDIARTFVAEKYILKVQHIVAVIKAKNMDCASCANCCESDFGFQAEAFFTHLKRYEKIIKAPKSRNAVLLSPRLKCCPLTQGIGTT